MRVLMLVATSVATDTRVLREAATLVEAGHEVHVVGLRVPPGYVPPAGVTVSSVGAGSLLRPEGSATLSRRRLAAPVRAARWLLLPEHRNQSFRRWARGAERDALGRAFDVVHLHDFTALQVGHRLAAARGVPLVYDSHELWSGRPRVGRPTPWQHAHELHLERRLGRDAVAVLTVGEGVADELRRRHGWQHVSVVRNTFPLRPAPAPLPAPTAALYTGRLAPYRELEVLAAASRLVDLPMEVMGPADQTWLAGFDPGQLTVGPARPVEEVDVRLAAAGLALVTHSDRWANHRLALPNKLFHAVRAGVPVVATDVGELAATVRAHGLGTLYRPGDPQDCARAVTEAVARYPELVAAVRRAAPELSWQADAAVLTGVYDRLAR
jgi:glycosyltransferase involved in cell wall biosynthesis